MVDLKALPDDTEKLKAIISQQVITILDKESIIKARDSHLKIVSDENAILREALRLARMRRFASTSEVYHGDQNELFDEAEGLVVKEAQDGASDEDDDTIEVAAHKKRRPKRKPFPDNLPRKDVVIALSTEERICEKDGTILEEIGEDVSEQLDIIPQQMTVTRTIRKKYACRHCEECVKTAPVPAKILPKSNATPGLLSYIAISKYIDALPLYRLEQMFKRSGIDIPRNTMASWMIKLSEKLIPIYNLMQDALLQSTYLCCDETTVQVLNEAGRTPQSKSYMWVRTRHGPDVAPIVLFDYAPSRSGDVPNELLEGFSGVLQVDGYGGYNKVCNRADVVRVSCMAHIRREFYNAHKIAKKKGGAAHKVLQWIGQLYKIEEAIREQDIAERYRVRQEKSKPIFLSLGEWLNDNSNKYPPGGSMGKAIGYARGQWSYMEGYLNDGRLSIDNNFTENRIRPFAVGRKNWLFSDSVAGAQASAMLYSIIQTACGNGLEPYAYMRHLLTELPHCQTVDQIESLAPHEIDPNILD